MTQLRDYTRERDARDGFRGAAWITGGAAFVAAGIAAVTYRFDDPEPETSRVVPLVAPNGGGAALTGRF
ncbi:MAG TPA: hypothetical protein VGF94_03030 [Kofleriaceae bacterium]|jgi:hypothetical protein